MGDNELMIAIVSDRHIGCGEELSMDYCSYTHSEVEYSKAVCLCGSPLCRGSFLHYAGHNVLQQICEENYGTAYRIARLMKASVGEIKASEKETLKRHGIKGAAFHGMHTPSWLVKFAYECLEYIEYERRILPSALVKENPNYTYTVTSAELEARSVMEQRV